MGSHNLAAVAIVCRVLSIPPFAIKRWSVCSASQAMEVGDVLHRRDAFLALLGRVFQLQHVWHVIVGRTGKVQGSGRITGKPEITGC
jgi:hypothetical protein